MTGPSVNHFGPGVIGQAAYEENKRIEESGTAVFGPGVLDTPPSQTPALLSEAQEVDLLVDQEAGPTPPAHNTLSITQLEKELQANPARFDELYRGEFVRPEGARKGALGVFLSHEQTHLNRPEVIEALTDMLKAKKA